MDWLARRRRRKLKIKWRKIFSKRGRRRFFKWILIAVIVLLVGYGAKEFYQLHQRQVIVQSQPGAKTIFIKQIAPEAEKMDRQYNVPASITIAQAILESNWGSSTLSAKYYNLFGVKSSSTQNSQLLNTKEYVNGQWVVVNGRFRVYASWDQSIEAHTMLMVNGTTSDPDKYKGVTSSTSYDAAAQALQNAGYATDPDYASKLVSIIHTYHLNKYDQ